MKRYQKCKVASVMCECPEAYASLAFHAVAWISWKL